MNNNNNCAYQIVWPCTERVPSTRPSTTKQDNEKIKYLLKCKCYLLSFQCHWWYYIPTEYIAGIGHIDNPQPHVWIGGARCWVANGPCLRKWSSAANTVGCHFWSRCKPWICHHAYIGVIEWSKHNVCSIRWAPNSFRHTEYFLCVWVWWLLLSQVKFPI